MKTQSAKAKGRKLQQWVRDQIIEQLEVHPEDIESRSMGAGGEDLIMARAARQKFPFSVECKNCLLYTSPSPRDRTRSRMPSSA